MKVVCDNCRAVYKIPDAKLVKPINKATCRNCGYRMLIPRPPASADGDFSTLVTAVPPTPMGAPPREKSSGTIEIDPSESFADSTEVIQRNVDSDGMSESTLDNDEMLLTLDKAPESRLPAAEEEAESVPDQSFLGADDDTRVTEVSKHLFNAGDTVKAPSPLHTNPGSKSPIYDPTTDLTFAILGTLGAIIGTFPMAALVFSPNPYLLWVGQAIAFGGATTALLILLTGGRGTRPANRAVSIIVGAILAVIVATLTTAVKVGHENIDWAELSAAVKASSIVVEPIDEEVATEEGDAAADDGTADGEEAPSQDEEDGEDEEGATKSDEAVPATAAKTTTAPSTRQRTTSTKPAPRPTPRPTSSPRSSSGSNDDLDLDDLLGDDPSPTPSASDESDDLDDFEDELLLDDEPLLSRGSAPAPAPAPQPQAADSVPIEVIDVMLRNHMDIKKCFGYYAKSHGGRLPSRIDIRFTLQTNGRASNLSIKQAEHTKTDLEQCLRTAVGGITFPPTSKPQKLTYPFILQ